MMSPVDLPLARSAVPLAVACALLAGCAAGGWSPDRLAAGDPRERVVAEMGPPGATHALPGGGARLEYNHQPAGTQTFMVDLDAAGRVTQWQQVLDERHFGLLRVGMTREDVLRELGAPSERGRYPLPAPAESWVYRYASRDRCQIFQVSFGAASGRTLDAGEYIVDPRCAMSSD